MKEVRSWLPWDKGHVFNEFHHQLIVVILNPIDCTWRVSCKIFYDNSDDVVLGTPTGLLTMIGGSSCLNCQQCDTKTRC